MPDREAFLQTLDEEVYDKLLEVSIKLNMNVQKLIRYVVIPEWMKKEQKK